MSDDDRAAVKMDKKLKLSRNTLKCPEHLFVACLLGIQSDFSPKLDVSRFHVHAAGTMSDDDRAAVKMRKWTKI
ncbi:uncharacterized protein V6R79_011466 [Siganus canaliculatus]